MPQRPCKRHMKEEFAISKKQKHNINCDSCHSPQLVISDVPQWSHGHYSPGHGHIDLTSFKALNIARDYFSSTKSAASGQESAIVLDVLDSRISHLRHCRDTKDFGSNYHSSVQSLTVEVLYRNLICAEEFLRTAVKADDQISQAVNVIVREIRILRSQRGVLSENPNPDRHYDFDVGAEINRSRPIDREQLDSCSRCSRGKDEYEFHEGKKLDNEDPAICFLRKLGKEFGSRGRNHVRKILPNEDLQQNPRHTDPSHLSSVVTYQSKTREIIPVDHLNQKPSFSNSKYPTLLKSDKLAKKMQTTKASIPKKSRKLQESLILPFTPPQGKYLPELHMPSKEIQVYGGHVKYKYWALVDKNRSIYYDTEADLDFEDEELGRGDGIVDPEAIDVRFIIEI